MVSYQCSPLSTPDGIVSIFQQCGQLQKDKGDLDKFVAVVVLDEIGLAEDSPRMPLKVIYKENFLKTRHFKNLKVLYVCNNK